ncbi:MAG: F0F1 ATP synthase subunit alpha, partial [Rhodospirillaceae bacterium]
SGGIKLDLAQYREMAAFAQFASDLDPATQKLLARGVRLTELLKQDQYVPMSVPEQVVSIYAGTKGYLDAIDVKDVQRFEKSVIGAVQEKAPEIMASIESEKALTKDNEEKLKSFLDDFAKSFS